MESGQLPLTISNCLRHGVQCVFCQLCILFLLLFFAWKSELTEMCFWHEITFRNYPCSIIHASSKEWKTDSLYIDAFWKIAQPYSAVFILACSEGSYRDVYMWGTRVTWNFLWMKYVKPALRSYMYRILNNYPSISLHKLNCHCCSEIQIKKLNCSVLKSTYKDLIVCSTIVIFFTLAEFQTILKKVNQN